MSDMSGLEVQKWREEFDISGLNESYFSNCCLHPGMKYGTNQVQSIQNVLDSALLWSWDTSAGNWDTSPHSKVIVTSLDPNNNTLSELLQNWNGSAIVSQSLFQYAYNAQNKRIHTLKQKDVSGTWVNDRLDTLIYDANNRLINSQVQNWNGSIWENKYRKSYSYNSAGEQLTYLSESWNGTNWDTLTLDSALYDSNNNKIGQVILSGSTPPLTYSNRYSWTYAPNNLPLTRLYEKWNSGSWNNFILTSNSYNINNQLDSSYDQYWISGSWKDSVVTTHGYDAQGNRINSLVQKYSGATLQNNRIMTYAYDGNHNQTYALTQTWNGSSWVNRGITNSSYDANSFLIWDAFVSFNSSGTFITDGDSLYTYFRVVVGLDEQATKEHSLLMYPNPIAGPSLNVSIPGFPGGEIMVEIWNATGQRLYSKKANYDGNLHIDASGLSEGLYILKISSGFRVSSTRFVCGPAR